MKGAAGEAEPDASGALVVGIARYCARFRPSYPRELLDFPVCPLASDGMGQQLVLVSGAGALAPRIADLTGLNPEPELLVEAAAREARPWQPPRGV